MPPVQYENVTFNFQLYKHTRQYIRNHFNSTSFYNKSLFDITFFFSLSLLFFAFFFFCHAAESLYPRGVCCEMGYEFSTVHSKVNIIFHLIIYGIIVRDASFRNYFSSCCHLIFMFAKSFFFFVHLFFHSPNIYLFIYRPNSVDLFRPTAPCLFNGW